jgi:excisionase family DNA binding protein
MIESELAFPVPDALVEAIAQRTAKILLEREQTVEHGSPWLSIADAAVYLGVSERTIERAIARGRLRSSTIGSRRLLHRDDLDAFVRATTGEEVAPTTPSRRRRD